MKLQIEQDHSRKVSQISAMLAGYMGYSSTDIEIIRQAALYHDIGKNLIDPELLNRPGPLTEREFDTVKTHAMLGSDIIAEAIRVLAAAYQIAKYHHERYDGTGYPGGLAGDEIPHIAQLVAVADVWDACASKRCYKPALSIDAVIAYFREQAGVQYNKEIVSVLLGRADDFAAMYR